MNHEDDRLPDTLRDAARGYHEPPALHTGELDAMWDAIEPQAFPRRFASPSATRRAYRERWVSARTLLPLAATLLLGVLIGRYSRRGMRDIETPAANVARVDSVAVPEPYQSTTSQYLGQTAALLVALPAEIRNGRADAQFMDHAHDLLLTTRLLLDSPAASDARLRGLLEDLELVLAQVVRLQSDQRPGELELIRQALDQRDVLPRLRTAAADISADD